MGRIESCSRCCIGVSVPGMVFLTIVGYMFDVQPIYTSLDVTDTKEASLNCYIAALLYAIAILLSCGGLYYEKRQRARGIMLRDEPYGEEGAELLGGNDSGYGALSNLSQMPLMPQGYTRGN